MLFLALPMITLSTHVVVRAVRKDDWLCCRDSPLRSQPTLETESFPILLMSEGPSKANLFLVESTFWQHTQACVARIEVSGRIIIRQ